MGDGMKVADHLFAGLLEEAPDAMLCLAGDGRIVLVNAQAERLFGYQRDELEGEPVQMLIPEDAEAGHLTHPARYMACPAPRPAGARTELPGRRRDGSVFPAEISLSAIDTGDGILGIAAVRDAAVRDVTGWPERQLRQSQRLESLGQLTGGVAHGYNNLLAVISSYAAFVAEEVAQGGRNIRWHSVRDDVAQIRQAAERATELTHQLLAFARRDVAQPRPLNLNEVITGVEHLLVGTLGEHVILETRLAAEPCVVLADPGQIEQVLVNLAVNARDAMPAGGRLVIETGTTYVDEAPAGSHPGLPQGQYACLKISDTGVGMTKGVIEHAFEPFFTTKLKGEGTGLGLATVSWIITQASGDVQIWAEPGTGTTVTVLLPSARLEVTARPELAQAAGHSAGETVLVVEDEPAMREVTRRILSRSGYHVLTAASGREAIEIATSTGGDIDLLLADVVMPQMLGKEAADRIRAFRPGVKVLFMSGYTQGLLDTQGVVAEEGVNLIEKPFTEAALLTRLRQVMG
jgi:PAS domain S-box-containing protein